VRRERSRGEALGVFGLGFSGVDHDALVVVATLSVSLRSSQLLREFDDVAVRVGDVERPFTPWPVHRSAEDLDTEASQPLRFSMYVFDQEADLAARRVAALRPMSSVKSISAAAAGSGVSVIVCG
jgi:hypothetical protein